MEKSAKKLLVDQPASPSLRKTLGVAAMAASLGAALGVPVGDVLAADQRLNTPADAAGKNLTSEQLKMSNQGKFSQQFKENQSGQIKGAQSSQFKDKQSMQFKDKQSAQFKDKQSTQIKIDRAAQQKAILK
ncbi:MAG: hypothetical protein ACM3SV_06550 [Betaproteobacteria bacterium]